MAESHRDRDVEHFNRWAATYEDSRKQGIFFDRIQRAVLELAQNNSPKTILDVGCGTGRLLRKAKEQWPDVQVFGVDPAEAMITQATRLLPSGKFYVAMAESLPLPDQSVDLAFSTMSYHHWANQDRAVKEIARVLRPNGRFLLADIVMPRGLSFIFRHTKMNNRKRIRETFEAAGLTVQVQQRRLAMIVITVGKKSSGD
jgi:ubiquinone/menaquinone biosynthesis C-methylase UbiE